MSEELVSIVGTHEVPASVYSAILTSAYEGSKEFMSPPSLLLLGTNTKESLDQYTRHSHSRAPVDPSFKSPFIGWSVEEIAEFIFHNAEGTNINPMLFLVADQQTSEDGDTLVLVQLDLSETEGKEYEIISCRMNAESANVSAVTVAVACGCVSEMVDLVESDGVYRLDTAAMREKREARERSGSNLPRKQLLPPGSGPETGP